MSKSKRQNNKMEKKIKKMNKKSKLKLKLSKRLFMKHIKNLTILVESLLNNIKNLKIWKTKF